MSRVSKDTQPGSGTAAFRGLLASTAPEAGSGCLSGKDVHPKRDQKQFGVVLPKPRPGAQPGEKATSVADATARHTLLVTPWLRTCLSAPAPCCWPQRGHRFCPRDPTVTPAAPGASSLDRASSFPDSLTSHESLDRWVWPAEPSSPASSQGSPAPGGCVPSAGPRCHLPGDLLTLTAAAAPGFTGSRGSSELSALV